MTDMFALLASAISTSAFIAFAVRKVSTSTLVYVVAWVAMRTSCPATYYAVVAFVAS